MRVRLNVAAFFQIQHGRPCVYSAFGAPKLREKYNSDALTLCELPQSVGHIPNAITQLATRAFHEAKIINDNQPHAVAPNVEPSAGKQFLNFQRRPIVHEDRTLSNLARGPEEFWPADVLNRLRVSYLDGRQ